MAKMISSMVEFKDFGQLTEADIDSVLLAGAQIYVDTWKKVILEKHYQTGAMHDAVASTEVKHAGASAYVEVYPQGTDSNGTSNALKAFVAHNGKRRAKKRARKNYKRRSGDHFVNTINTMAEADAKAAMERKLAEIQSKGSNN